MPIESYGGRLHMSADGRTASADGRADGRPGDADGAEGCAANVSAQVGGGQLIGSRMWMVTPAQDSPEGGACRPALTGWAQAALRAADAPCSEGARAHVTPNSIRRGDM